MSVGTRRAPLASLLLWLYWLAAFWCGYWMIFLIAALVRGRRGIAWAMGNYAGSFFRVARLLLPGFRIDVHERARLHRTSGSVVVCNHLSFLDPLLLVWLLPDVITVVRPDFFRVPIFGWILRGAGFLGPHLFTQGQPWIDKIGRHLSAGGNLLIFPEGTRSRDGRLSPFKKGAFYLAKHLAAPLIVLEVAGTDQVFPPGQLTFNVAPARPVLIRALARLESAEVAQTTRDELARRVFEILDAQRSEAAEAGVDEH